MTANLEIDACEAYERVSNALIERGINFKRDGLKYEIPNFCICFREVVNIANQALWETPFYAQEMPYREMLKWGKGFAPEHMLILHRDHDAHK